MSKVLSVSRIEKKYVVGSKERFILQNYFAKILYLDPNNKTNGYLVRSLYFDTIFDNDYNDKLEGLEERQKIRLRIYDPLSDDVKLELKQKIGNFQFKRSLDINKQIAIKMIRGDISDLRSIKEPLAQEISYMMMSKVYRPKCIVQYQRYAFVYPANNIRITFDNKLEGTFTTQDFFSEKLNTVPVFALERSIMEVKYDNFMLSYIKDIISNCNVAQTAASKYCLVRELV